MSEPHSAQSDHLSAHSLLGRFGRLLALTTSGVLAVGVLGAPAAQADSAPSRPVAASPAPAESPTAQAIVEARTKAKATGQPVLVDLLSTATSETVVNPSGTLSTTSHAQPVRIPKGAAWADIDATLHPNADGTLSPAAVPTGVTLSGGGSGPMATLTTADGKRLSVTAPFPLPVPTLSGATATYAGVLTPDVDLQVTALPTGGWRDVVIVRTAAAAANPALKTLHFPISATGLSVSADPAGNIALKDTSGTTRISAPTPFQWDSGQAAPAGSLAKSLTTQSTSGASTPTTAASTADAPGPGATVARMTATATAGGIDLTPDATSFGQGTGPWYLDPTISATGSASYATQVQEYNSGTAYGNMSGSLGTGYCGYLSGGDPCPSSGRERAYFQIGIPAAIYTVVSGAPKAPTLYKATLFAGVTSQASPSTTTPLGLWSVEGDTGTGSGVGNWTSWNNQRCGTGSTMANCPEVGKFNVTGTGNLSYDVLSYMNTLAQCNCTSWTVALAPEDENNKYYRVHVANNPSVTIEYDVTPSTWNPRTSPQPGFASTAGRYDCTTAGTNPWDNPAWVGNNQNITLTASSWSPSGMNLQTSFHLWDDNNPNYSLVQSSGWAGSWNPNGLSTGVSGSSLSDGHQYGWSANSTDGGLTSPDTGWCYFRIDKTPPAVSISSTQFPPSGTPNPNPALYAGQTGTFALAGTDPAPAGGAASGVACYRVSTDPTPVTGWSCAGGWASGIVLPSSPTFQFTPGNWGTNLLYAQAQDNAGNYSQPAAYSFYAPWNPQAPVVFGDITGDGKPDIVLPDAAGNLKLISATTDPTNAISARATLSPNKTGWNGIQLTHRGSLALNVAGDYLFAHAPQDPDLTVYANNGNGGFAAEMKLGSLPATCQDAAGSALPAGCPSNWGTNWAGVTQLLALGTPEGESNTSTSVTRTALLAVINNNLWLFHGNAPTVNANGLDGTARLLSTADWSKYDLINPGPANGGNQPTLWARNRTDGTLHAYRVTGGATPDYSDLSDPVTRGTTIAGIALPTAGYPTVGSSGDLNGDAVPDLWATSATGALTLWTGTADTTGKVTGFANPSNPTNLVNLPTPLGRWTLTGADSTGTKTPDSLGRDGVNTLGTHPGNLSNVSFAADNPTGSSATTVATLNGTNSEMDTTGPVVDTTKSFTVSLWVKPSANALNSVVLSQDGTNTSGFMLFPAGDGNWHFGMATADNMAWPYDEANTRNSTDRMQPGVWAQLKVSYDSAGGQMNLYVNGNLAASGTHTGKLAFNGPLTVGRYQNAGKNLAYFNGSVSDLTVYPYATNPSTTTAHPIRSSIPANKCIDDNGAGTANGTAIQIVDCNGTAAQQWTVNSDNTLTVMGGCLDNTNANPNNGNLVEWFTCNGSPAQQWIPRADGSIYNPNSGRCLDLTGGNTANGTRLELFDCNGSPAQRWLLAATG